MRQLRERSLGPDAQLTRNLAAADATTPATPPSPALCWASPAR